MVSTIARSIYKYFKQKQPQFESSQQYWEDRYYLNGNSGDGSYGRLARFKADVVNAFVKEQNIKSIIELGCGDGAQLALMDYPSYIGVDVSKTILKSCKSQYSSDMTKRFVLLEDLQTTNPICEMSLSLDVIYHLVEDEVYNDHMHSLFSSALRWVIVYSSNMEAPTEVAHVKHRNFTHWVEEKAQNWVLYQKIDQKYSYVSKMVDRTSFADFYIFRRNTDVELV